MPFFKKKSIGNNVRMNTTPNDLSYSRSASASPAPPSHRSSPSIRDFPTNPYARAQDHYSSRDYQHRPAAQSHPSEQTGYSDSSYVNRNVLFGNRPTPRAAPRQDPYARHDLRGNEQDRYAENQQKYQENPEEEEIEGIKQEIRFTKQKSLASTQNALAKAQEAEETGRYALTRLGEQHAKFANIERHMDIARSQAEDGHGQTKLLKKLNDRPFFVPVSDVSRKKGYEERAARRYDEEMAAAGRRRNDAFEYKQRIDMALDKPGSGRSLKKKAGQHRVAGIDERSRYTFEGDAEDDQMEKDIDVNLNQLSDITGRLKLLAIATQKELDHQNEQIDRMVKTGDDVQRRVHLNTKRLQTIR
jgi:protein transport protein SEC9